MGQKLRPLPMGRLLEHMIREMEMSATVFSVPPGFRGDGRSVPLPQGPVESPLGLAAGPHTQMAQSLAAGYAAGARVFELSAVRPGSVGASTPYIEVERDGYHGARAGTLTWEELLGEHIKGWFLLQLLSRELGLGDKSGFAFLMGVEGDVETLSGAEVSAYLDGMADASTQPVWRECVEAALARLGQMNNVDLAFVEGISPQISRWVRLRVRPGDTPEEVEEAGEYLLRRGLFVDFKLDATFLGYDRARESLDRLGGSALTLDRRKFGLTWGELAPALDRVSRMGAELGRKVGVSLSGGLPLAGGRRLTGPAVTAAALELAAEVAREMPGTAISFAGGADALNGGALYAAGLAPVLCATTLLKPGGYLRLRQMAKAMAAVSPALTPDAARLEALREETARDAAHRVDPGWQRRRMAGPAPMLGCFTAPCRGGCPFEQDVTGYLRLMSDGRFRDALQVILDRNPLPNIAGAICPAPCQGNCTRLFYDEAVDVRGASALCVQTAWRDLLPRLEPEPPRIGQRVAVIGGGPAGMSAAFLLARRGVPVTLFEKESRLGGAVRRFVPQFRVTDQEIDRDAKLLELMGVDVRLNTPAPEARRVMEMGYSHVLVAIGAPVPAMVPLAEKQPLDALTFLAGCRADDMAYAGCQRLVVMGDGDTAMDVARVGLRQAGIKKVTVVSRAARREMQAQPQMVQNAQDEGAEFLYGWMAVAWDGQIVDLINAEDGSTTQLIADLVVCAVGELVDGGALARHGITLNSHGRPMTNDALESVVPHVYVLGDARRGPANVAEAIADAHRVVDDILGAAPPFPHTAGRRGGAMGKKGKLANRGEVDGECDRCLGCSTVCESCVDVCPNRANLPIAVPTRRKPQILHLDTLCDRCGTCAASCPFESRPCEDRFTLFETVEDFEAGDNPGFVVLDFLSRKVRVRLEGRTWDESLRGLESGLPGAVRELMETVFIDYPYLLDPDRRKDEVQLSLWTE